MLEAVVPVLVPVLCALTVRPKPNVATAKAMPENLRKFVVKLTPSVNSLMI
jgi:hypothetical protein